jgi:microcystin-dependent protein
MSHLLDELLAQAANGSPVTVTFSAESVAVLLFASGFLDVRSNWLDTGEFPLDEITDADWDEIEKLVAEVYSTLMNPLIGQILPIATASMPENMLLCDGNLYYRTQYPQLYAVLDPVFIVDADTFNVPDLRGRVPIGSGTGTGLTSREIGDAGGDETVSLVAAQNGSHSHAVTDAGHSHTPLSPATNFRGFHTGGAGGIGAANNGVTNDSFTTTGTSTTGIAIQNSGSGSPHINMQPFLCLNFGIVAY